MSKVILVVDDDPLYIDLVSRVFETRGHTIIQAADGAAALQQVGTHHIDMIVSDIEMPVMSGLDLHREVRSLAQHAQTPFIFLTGTTDEGILRRASTASGALLIRKSNLVKELLTLLEQMT